MRHGTATGVPQGKRRDDYKFSSAVLEDYYNVSPDWRNRYLAASLFYLPSSDASRYAVAGEDARGRACGISELNPDLSMCACGTAVSAVLGMLDRRISCESPYRSVNSRPHGRDARATGRALFHQTGCPHRAFRKLTHPCTLSEPAQTQWVFAGDDAFCTCGCHELLELSIFALSRPGSL